MTRSHVTQCPNSKLGKKEKKKNYTGAEIEFSDSPASCQDNGPTCRDARREKPSSSEGVATQGVLTTTLTLSS